MTISPAQVVCRLKTVVEQDSVESLNDKLNESYYYYFYFCVFVLYTST